MAEELLSVLQQTQHFSKDVRGKAEQMLQLAAERTEFVPTLLEVSSSEGCPLHLRQLALVLATQQVRQRYPQLSTEVHNALMESAFTMMNNTDNNLRNAGSVLLACIFVSGAQQEKENIISQLYEVLISDDHSYKYLATRCLCEILEEATFKSQIDILVRCDRALRNIVSSGPSDESILRNISKAYRLVSLQVSDARLANDFTADIDDCMTEIFSSWMAVVIDWCTRCTALSDIFKNMGVLIEMIQFLSTVVESFPSLCDLPTSGKRALGTIMQIDWQYLSSLVSVHTETNAEARCSSLIAYDGDRIEVGVLVIHLFDLLKLCIDNSSREENERLTSDDLRGLSSIIIQYMQLSDEQVDQYLNDANEYIALDQDDSLELSLRHSGCDFLIEIFMCSPNRMLDAVLSNVERDLMEFYTILNGGLTKEEDMIQEGVVISQPVQIPLHVIVSIEASLYALRCLGKKYVKRYIRHQRFGEVRIGAEESIEAEVLRLQRVGSGLVNTFFNHQFLSLASCPAQEGASSTSLSLCRGATSSFVCSYVNIFPSPFLSFLGVLRPFCFLESESMPARMNHSLALSAILVVMVKSEGYEVLLQESFFESVLKALMEISISCSELTIHIPLEQITWMISVSTSALRSSVEQQAATVSMPHFLPLAAIPPLVELAMKTWQAFQNDPFCLEVVQELVQALFSSLVVPSSLQAGESSDLERLRAFSDSFVPQLLVMVNSMPTGEQAKMVSDLALRTVTSCLISLSSPPLSATLLEAAWGMLGRPCLQVISKVLSLPAVDTGDTLRSFSTLCSWRGLDPSSRESEEVVDSVLEASRGIVQASEEFNYSAVCGCLSHLLPRFREDQEAPGLSSLLHLLLARLGEGEADQESSCVLVMGFVHMLCRRPVFVSGLLSSLPVVGGERPLALLMDAWFHLHSRLASRYNRHVSTLGLLQVLELYCHQGVGEAFLVRLLQTVVQSILEAESDAEEGYETNNEPGLSTLSLCSEQDDGYSTEENYQEDEESGNDQGNAGAFGDDNPFAPAEMYLSDLLDMSGNSSTLYIPDELVYAKHHLDPLYEVSLRCKLKDILHQHSHPTGLLAKAVNLLDMEKQRYIDALMC